MIPPTRRKRPSNQTDLVLLTYTGYKPGITYAVRPYAGFVRSKLCSTRRGQGQDYTGEARCAYTQITDAWPRCTVRNAVLQRIASEA